MPGPGSARRESRAVAREGDSATFAHALASGADVDGGGLHVSFVDLGGDGVADYALGNMYDHSGSLEVGTVGVRSGRAGDRLYHLDG